MGELIGQRKERIIEGERASRRLLAPAGPSSEPRAFAACGSLMVLAVTRTVRSVLHYGSPPGWINNGGAALVESALRAVQIDGANRVVLAHL